MNYKSKIRKKYRQKTVRISFMCVCKYVSVCGCVCMWVCAYVCMCYSYVWMRVFMRLSQSTNVTRWDWRKGIQVSINNSLHYLFR